MTKKKIVEINLGNFGSTGKIMRGIATTAENSGFDVYLAYPKTSGGSVSKNDIIICSYFMRRVFQRIAHYLSLNERICFFRTKRLVCKLKKIHPDIIHLHNIHGSFLHLGILFNYIKKFNIKVVWTLHDCWAFTGHCTYFSFVNCNKWKNECKECPLFKDYPQSLLDDSARLFNLKKKWFLNVENIELITPSKWLESLVRESFLRQYDVLTIYNGVDLNIFKPTISDFRIKYNIPHDNFIILGVAFCWSKRKGVDVFIELAKRLPHTFQIVLVGSFDKNNKPLIPSNIILINSTKNQIELASIYSAADLFVNPTREETLGLVNIESLSCGTPVVSFKTGGCPECLDKSCGSTVECDDIESLEKEIIRVCSTKPFSSEACLSRARAFNEQNKYREYVDIYKTLLNNRRKDI